VSLEDLLAALYTPTLPRSLELIFLKGKPFLKMSTSCVLLFLPSSPPKKKETTGSDFVTDYATELHRCCSLDSSINSLHMHFYFAVQNYFYDHMSFLWC